MSGLRGPPCKVDQTVPFNFVASYQGFRCRRASIFGNSTWLGRDYLQAPSVSSLYIAGGWLDLVTFSYGLQSHGLISLELLQEKVSSVTAVCI